MNNKIYNKNGQIFLLVFRRLISHGRLAGGGVARHEVVAVRRAGAVTTIALPAVRAHAHVHGRGLVGHRLARIVRDEFDDHDSVLLLLSYDDAAAAAAAVWVLVLVGAEVSLADAATGAGDVGRGAAYLTGLENESSVALIFPRIQ